MAATSMPIPVEGAKTTINLTKGKEISSLAFEKEEYSVLMGHTRGLWELNLIVYYNDGSKEYLNYQDMNLTSSNENTFTVGTYELNSIAIGNATLTAEYNGHKATTNIRVVEPNADVVIKLPENPQQGYANLSALQSLNTSGDYYERMDIQTDYNMAKNEFTIFGIDWSVAGPYIGFITQGNRLYKITLNQQDKGKTIELGFNEDDYTRLTLNVPTKTNDAVFSDISLTTYDSNENKIDAGAFYQLAKENNQIYVPKGTYAMQIIAEEGNDAYNLFTKKLNLTNQDDFVMFNEEDLAKLTFNLDISGNAQVEEAGLCNSEYMNTCYYISSNSRIDNIYSSKQDHTQSFSFNVSLDNNWGYEFEKQDLNVSSNQIINVNDQLKTNLKFSQSSYTGGERIYLGDSSGTSDVLQVTDSYGNKLSGIYHERNIIPGILTFTKGAEVYKVEVENLAYPSIVLPNAEGTFEVTFTVGDQPTIPDDRVKANISGDWKEWNNTRIVSHDYQWAIKFNDELNASSVNESNIFVVDNEGYLVKGGTVSLSSDDRQKVYVSAPAGTGYEAGKTYTLYINDNIESVKGHKLSPKVKMSFTIQ